MPPNDDERSPWEQEEARAERAELQKLLQMQLDILRESPELAAQMVALQRRVFEHNQAQDVPHICPVCRRKRQFVTLVETLVTVLTLRTGEQYYFGALACALRTPATVLATLHLSEAAQELVRWYADEALPADQRTVPQPAWYSKKLQEWDGHE